MEFNETNYRILDAALIDYINTYCEEMPEKELRENAFKFAIKELIHDRIKARDYKIVNGAMVPDDIKCFDVIIPYDIHYGDCSEISVAFIDRDCMYACYVERGADDAASDKIRMRQYIMD